MATNNYTWGIAGLIAAILTAIGIGIYADKPQTTRAAGCSSCGSMRKYLQ